MVLRRPEQRGDPARQQEIELVARAHLRLLGAPLVLFPVEPLPLLPPLPRLFALHAGYGSEGGRHRMIVEQPHPFVHFRTESEDPVWLRVAHPRRDSVAAVLAAVAAVSWRDARRITGSRRRGPRAPPSRPADRCGGWRPAGRIHRARPGAGRVPPEAAARTSRCGHRGWRWSRRRAAS